MVIQTGTPAVITCFARSDIQIIEADLLRLTAGLLNAVNDWN
jgi:hypothetical protein